MTQTVSGAWSIGGGLIPMGGAIAFNGADRFTLETLDGNRYDHVRMTPVTLSPAQLKEFTGAYASEETGATYRLAADKDKLVLSIDRAPASILRLSSLYKDA